MMKLKLNTSKEKHHKDIATCIEWVSADEVVSSGDDHTVSNYVFAFG